MATEFDPEAYARAVQAQMAQQATQAANAAVAEATRPRTEQELNTARVLAALSELGGQSVRDDTLVFEGSRFVIPANLEGNVQGVIRFLAEWDQAQNTHYENHWDFEYRPYDGAAAFDRAMRRVFGTSGVGKTIPGFFGNDTAPPSITVPSGPHGEVMQVPWGEVSFSLLDATFDLSATDSSEFGVVFHLSVDAPRKYQQHLEGFVQVVRDELATRSIYKGHAITADPVQPQFFDTDDVDAAKVIYTREVRTQLDVSLWDPMRYTHVLREQGIPLKRAVLLEGPNGTGKTLAGSISAQIAEKFGWTFVLVRSGEDALAGIKTAAVYAPALVWIEDLDVLASSSMTRAKVVKVLDELDNVTNKGREVMVGFTSNVPRKLEKGVIRPGRLDSVIHIAELDAPGYETLIRAMVPADLLDPEVDFEQVTAAFAGSMPSFAAEAAQRAVRYSIHRTAGHPDRITTEDLLEAAAGMRAHQALMDAAETAGTTPPPALEAAFMALVGKALANTVGQIGVNSRRRSIDMEFSSDGAS